MILSICCGCSTGQENIRETVISSLELDYPIDINSIYWNERTEKPYMDINENYRPVEPATSLDLDNFRSELVVAKTQGYHEFGDAILSYLANAESPQISDDNLIKILGDSNTDIHITTFDYNNFHHRIILIGSSKENISYIRPSFCYLQSWNDNEIKSQALYEGLPVAFDGVDVIFKQFQIDDGSKILIMQGLDTTDNFGSGGSHLAPFFCAWEWTDAAWVPFILDEHLVIKYLIDDDILADNLHIFKDGVRIENQYSYDANSQIIEGAQEYSMGMPSDQDIIQVKKGQNVIAQLTFN